VLRIKQILGFWSYYDLKLLGKQNKTLLGILKVEPRIIQIL